MTITTIRIMIGVVAACLCLSNLQPQEMGWYGGLGAGQSTVDIDEAFWTDSSILDSTLGKQGTSFHAYGGYMLNRHFGVEVGYLHTANTEFRGQSNGVGTIWQAGPVEGITRIDGFMLQGVGLLPSGISRLKFYLKGGLFFSNTLTVHNFTINQIDRFHDDGVTLIGGGGIQLRVWHNWHLRGEAQYTVVPLENKQTVGVSYVTIGLMHPIE